MGRQQSLRNKAAHFVSDLTTVILNPISDKPSKPHPHPPTPHVSISPPLLCLKNLDFSIFFLFFVVDFLYFNVSFRIWEFWLLGFWFSMWGFTIYVLQVIKLIIWNLRALIGFNHRWGLCVFFVCDQFIIQWKVFHYELKKYETDG